MLPKGLLKEIISCMRNFWWSSFKDKHKIAWVSWDKITRSKKEGRLGIRDLEDFIISLLAKQGLQLIKHPQSLLARVYKAKYYCHSNFLEAKFYSTSSYEWRSIIQTRDLLRKGIKWVVGNGESIRVWKDNWIKSKPATTPIGSETTSNPQFRVCELFAYNTKEWNIHLVRSLFNEDDADYILRIRPSTFSNPDQIIWSYTREESIVSNLDIIFKGK